MRKCSAFTMIEMLVVLGIILVLAGMLYFGGRAVFNRSRENATRATLNNLANMVAELDAKTRGVSELNDIYTNASANPLPAPGNIAEDAYPVVATDRYENDAIALTQDVMEKLSALPLNKSALGQFPSEQILKKPPAAVPALSIDADDNLSPPIIVDAWGNPIIFVPGGGLSGVGFEQLGDSNLQTVTSPNGRPFWASAGPDGVFGFVDPDSNPATPNEIYGGDDNIYSFEN